MLIYRRESFGGIVFDSDKISFSCVNAMTDGEMEKVGRYIERRPAHERTDILSAPVFIYAELTRRCNLRCRHCFTKAYDDPSHGMNADGWYSLLDEMQSAGVINIRFTGGEPTFRPDWYEIMKRARQLGFVISLQTNGMYADVDDTVSRIAALGIEQVTVSLDGVGDTHDELRGKGSFDRLMNTLCRMKTAGVGLRFNTVLTRRSAAELDEIFRVAGEFGVSINLFYLRPIGDGGADGSLPLDFHAHAESAVRAATLQKAYPALRVLHSGYCGARAAAGEGVPDLPYQYGFLALSVAADGSYWPHHYSMYQGNDFCLGSYPGDRLLDVWSRSKRLDGFRGWMKALLARCEGCIEYRRRCAGVSFEMEVERMLGRSGPNPFCVSGVEAPSPWGFMAGTGREAEA